MKNNLFDPHKIPKGSSSLLLLSIFLFLSIKPQLIVAQYNLPQAIKDAKSNSTLSKLTALNTKIADLKLENISKNYYPKIAFSGQATYQSAVTELPIELPGIEIDAITKDQYKAQAEFGQIIYDGGTIMRSKEMLKTATKIENINVDMDLENLRAQTINLYFSILEIEAQTKILELKKENVESSLPILEAGIRNGVRQKSDLYELQAAIASIEQELAKLRIYRSQIIRSLKTLTEGDFEEDSTFELPPTSANLSTDYTNKLAFKQIDLQKDLMMKNQDLMESQSMPKATAFLNVGYGKPALNFLQNSFEPYGMGGVRVTWTLNNIYTKSKERQILQLNHEMLDERKALLTNGLDTKRDQYLNEIELLEAMITLDKEVLSIRTKLRESAESKFKNGILTASNLIPYINQENEVKEQIELRRLQLIKNQYLLNHLTGNYTF